MSYQIIHVFKVACDCFSIGVLEVNPFI